MRSRLLVFSLGLIASFGFVTVSAAQQQSDQQQAVEQRNLDQQQLMQQQIAQQQLAQQQQLEQEQLNQQALAQQSANVVIEPDVYLFGGDYYRGRDAHNYSRRGFESRGAAHSDGRRGGRR